MKFSELSWLVDQWKREDREAGRPPPVFDTGKEPLGEKLSVGFDTWEKCLPLLLIGYTEGTPTGRQMAMEGLQKMARVADMAVNMSQQVTSN